MFIKKCHFSHNYVVYSVSLKAFLNKTFVNALNVEILTILSSAKHGNTSDVTPLYFFHNSPSQNTVTTVELQWLEN